MPSGSGPAWSGSPAGTPGSPNWPQQTCCPIGRLVQTPQRLLQMLWTTVSALVWLTLGAGFWPVTPWGAPGNMGQSCLPGMLPPSPPSPSSSSTSSSSLSSLFSSQLPLPPPPALLKSYPDATLRNPLWGIMWNAGDRTRVGCV